MVAEEKKTAPDVIEIEVGEETETNHSNNFDSTVGAEDSEQEVPGPNLSIDLKFDSTKDGIRLIAAYHFVLSALLVLGMFGVSIPTVITAIVGVTEDSGALIATAILGIVGFVLLLLSALYSVVGYGLWKRRQWARTAAIALGILSLLFVPIGTLGGGVTLWYLLQERVARTFS